MNATQSERRARTLSPIRRNRRWRKVHAPTKATLSRRFRPVASRKLQLSALVLGLAVFLVAPSMHAQELGTDASQQVEKDPPRTTRQEGLFAWPWEFGLGIRPGLLASTHRSRDPFFADDAVFQLGLLLDVEALRGLFGQDRWRFGIEWQTTGVEESLFQTINGKLSEEHLLLSVDWGYPLFDIFTPYIRLAAGLAFYDAEFSAREKLSDEQYWLFSSHALVGLELVSDWDVRVGVRTDVGYALRQAPQFRMTAKSATPEEESAIPMQGTSIGSVEMSGFEWGLEFFIRY